VQTKIKTPKQLSFLIFALLLLSCNSNAVFDQYSPIENQQWHSEKSLEFKVKNRDTISENNVFITVRNNKDYAFSSLFLIAKIEMPNGFKVIDTLEYEMTDASGNWLGSGFTDLKENKLFYKENVVFSEIGTYKFNIQHATRSINDIEGKNPLKGITDVGLRIEKVQK
jgi:gliding motility-associated lipoprotein GldH